MKVLATAVIGIFALALAMYVPSSFAQTQTTMIPLTDELNLEKTVTVMTVPEDNVLPWGSVRGNIDNPAERYPVIIQFFKGEDPVHFAQVDVKGDGSYEYKFRVRSVNLDTGETIDIFEGDYIVKIFKVVNSTPQTI